jgi:hypothetical protein
MSNKIDPEKGKPIDYEKIELWQQGQNWKLAFFLLLLVIIIFIGWLIKGMPDSTN